MKPTKRDPKIQPIANTVVKRKLLVEHRTEALENLLLKRSVMDETVL